MTIPLLAALVDELHGVPTHASAPCLDLTSWTGHSDYARERREAAVKCYGCPIVAACDAAAEARGERFGVWGGRDRESEYREAHSAPSPSTGARVAACGTEGGYKRHLRRGEDACGPCRGAHATYRQALRTA